MTTGDGWNGLPEEEIEEFRESLGKGIRRAMDAFGAAEDNSDIAGIAGLTDEDAACLSPETANKIRRMAEIPANTSTEISRYADEAMFVAAPLVEEGGLVEPRVTLISMTPDPLRVIAAAAQMYRGDPVQDPGEVPVRMAIETFRQMSGKLQAPLEFVDLHFLIEGVTRAFTHQLVRQRTAVYVQESLRFAVKENAALEVALPPSLAGTEEDDPKRRIWDDTVSRVAWAYNALIGAGMPAEDARGLLPTNIATRVHYKTNLRNLADHAGMRLCSQAQHEWKQVWAQFIRAITDYGPESERWQQRAITRLFKPVCYQTGKCEFNSTMDRYCSIRERVEVHHRAGDPPDQWTDINPLEPLHYKAARRA